MKILHWLRKELLQIVLLALPFACVAAWWDKFPAVVATHWGLSGQPNGWMPKGPGLLFVPILNVGLCALLAWLPSIDPRMRRDADHSAPGYRRSLRVTRYAVTAFLTVLSLAMIDVAAGRAINMSAVIYNGTLIFFAILGNVMGTLRPNYFVGIRTPWTLEDPETWRATHRVAGRFMVFGSSLLLAVGPFVQPRAQLGLLLFFIAILALGSAGYSLWYFKRQRVGA